MITDEIRYENDICPICNKSVETTGTKLLDPAITFNMNDGEVIWQRWHYKCLRSRIIHAADQDRGMT